MSKPVRYLSSMALALLLTPGLAAWAAPQVEPVSPEAETSPAPARPETVEPGVPTTPPPPVPPAPTGTRPGSPVEPVAPAEPTMPPPDPSRLGTEPVPRGAEPGTPGMEPRTEPVRPGDRPPTDRPLPNPTGTDPIGQTSGEILKGDPLEPKDQKLAKRTLTSVQQSNATEIRLAQLALDQATSEDIKSYATSLIEDHRTAAEKVSTFAKNHDIPLPGGTVEAGAMGTPTGSSPDMPGMAAAEGRDPTAMAPGGTTAQGRLGQAGEQAGQVATDVVTGEQVGLEGLPDLSRANQRLVDRLSRLEGDRFERQFLTTMLRNHTKSLNKLRQSGRRAENVELKSLLTEIAGTVEGHLERAKDLKRTGLAMRTPS